MKLKQLSLACTLFLLALCVSGCKEKASQNEAELSTVKEENTTLAAPKADDMKKIIRAQVFIKAEKVDDFINSTKSLIEQSRAEEGNISYTLYQDPTDKTRFIFFEEWKNQQAIDFHFNTEHFKSFDASVGDYSSSPAVITIYDVASEK